MVQEFRDMSKRDETILLMNGYGSRRTPFLFVIDFQEEGPIILPLDQARENRIFYDINGNTNHPGRKGANQPLRFKKHPVTFDDYLQAFRIVQENLNRGNSYLLNLTFPTRIEINLTLQDIFLMSVAKYRLLLKNRFVAFSPETFVQIRDGEISSCPMKGTIDAHVEDAERRILSNPKETAEHTTIVDLIRNDLSSVAKSVRVDRFRYVERIRTNQRDLLQVSSRIAGRLPVDYHKNIGSILFSLLPAGSVTGAPKKKTVEIIQSAETYKRGYYTGVVGLFDGHNLDSGVLIRFIEQTDEGFVYKSGGGITVFSDPRAEYQEMIDKVYVPIV